MATSWAPAVHVLEDGTVEFTSKGLQALEAMFLVLDSDQSKGLSLDEMRLYFMLTEQLELSNEDFQGMGLKMMEENPNELSMEGFREIYKCIYENSIAEGDERLRKDLTTFGVDSVMKVVDATSLLMRGGGTSAERKSSVDLKAESAERKAKRKEPSSTAKRKATSTPPLSFFAKPKEATSPLPLSVEDAPESKVIDLTASNGSSNLLESSPSTIIDIAESPTKEVREQQQQKKAIHPFFLQSRGSKASSSVATIGGPTGGDAAADEGTGRPSYLRTLRADREFPSPSLSFPFSRIKLMHLPEPPLKPSSPSTPDTDQAALSFELPNHTQLWASAQSSPIHLIESIDENSLGEDDDVVDLEAENEAKRLAWTEKYRPKSSTELLGNVEAVAELRNWLMAWLVEKSRTDSEMSSSKSSSSDFVSEEEDDEDDLAWGNSGDEAADGNPGTKKSLILCGPSGAGKTCSVYAVAAELGFRVFEINASDDRSRIKQLVGEASQSYGLSKTGRSLELPLILVDEFDSGFHDDANFLSAVKALVKTARAPVVFVCDDVLPRAVSTNGKDLDLKAFNAAEVLRFERPKAEEVAPRLEEVLKKEKIISVAPSSTVKEQVLVLAKKFQGDMRACLQYIHFWRGLRGSEDHQETREDSEATDSFEDDGFSTLRAGFVQVFEMKPRKLNRADERFDLIGRYFSSANDGLKVFVQDDDETGFVMQCADSGQVDSDGYMKGCALVHHRAASEAENAVEAQEGDIANVTVAAPDPVSMATDEEQPSSGDTGPGDGKVNNASEEARSENGKKNPSRNKKRRVITDDDDGEETEDTIEKESSSSANDGNLQMSEKAGASSPDNSEPVGESQDEVEEDIEDDPDFEPLRGSHRTRPGKAQKATITNVKKQKMVQQRRGRKGSLDEFLEDGDASASNGAGPVRRKIRMNAVVEARFAFEVKVVDKDRVSTLKKVSIRARSDDELQWRHNSMYWCLHPSTLPPSTILSGHATVSKTIEVSAASRDSTSEATAADVTIDLDKARRNLHTLKGLARSKELAAFVDCVRVPRRGPVGDRMASQYSTSVEGTHSKGDAIAEDLAGYLLPMRSTLADSLEAAREEYIKGLKELHLRIDLQPTNAFWMDIPMYVRMCRLDEMRRVAHVGRRRFSGHFKRTGSDWLDPSSAARIGLADTDLGWEALVNEADNEDEEEAEA